MSCRWSGRAWPVHSGREIEDTHAQGGLLPDISTRAVLLCFTVLTSPFFLLLLPQPFTLDETKAYLISLHNLRGIDKKVLSFCNDRSGANPATTKRLVDSLLANQILLVDEGRELCLNKSKIKNSVDLEQIETPDSVRAFICATMAKLSHKSLDLLFLASTIGRYFSLGILEDAFEARPSSRKFPVTVLKSLVSGGILAKQKNGGSQRWQNGVSFFFRDQVNIEKHIATDE